MHSARPALIHRDVKSHNVSAATNTSPLLARALPPRAHVIGCFICPQVLMDSSLTAAKLCDFGITISVADVSATAGDQGTPMYQPLPSVLHTAFAY